VQQLKGKPECRELLNDFISSGAVTHSNDVSASPEAVVQQGRV
jgi:hypothetical protein